MRCLSSTMDCGSRSVLLVVWVFLTRVARRMIPTPSAMSIFVCLSLVPVMSVFFFFSSRRRHTIFDCDLSSDVCSSDLRARTFQIAEPVLCMCRAQGRGVFLDERLKDAVDVRANRLAICRAIVLNVRSRSDREIGRASCRERV